MTGLSAFYRAFTDPASESRDMTIEARQDFYAAAWSYYRNLQFSTRNGYDWSRYLAQRELYKHTRLIYNPVPAIVDFYVDNIWQPAVNEDFDSLVTPLLDKTEENHVQVIAQIDQWSNFESESQKIKRYAAATGNVLIEGIDDLERGKVLHRCVWPGYVTAIELDQTGNVQSYTLEYPVYDKDSNLTYQFRKEVDRQQFRYFKDDKPFAPEGKSGAVEVNPYGFCFAVWIRHTDDGADYGMPACKNLDKVDNVNSLASHIDDFIHKAVESPKLISAEGEILPLLGASTMGTDGRLANHDPRLNWMVLKAKPGASVHDLLGLLDLAAVSPELDRQIKSFEDDYPELQASSIIRENSQLSGAALERMLGPAQNRLDGVQSNYNQQLIKLRQMQIAVGGFRSRGGGWTSLTDQQRIFREFDLGSYDRGELNFTLKRSVLVQTTEMEDEELLMAKANRAVAMSELVDFRESLSIAGYNEDEIDEIEGRVNAEEAAEPDIDPAVIQAQRLANGGTLPRQLAAPVEVV
jgi:hypothetical protein